MKWKKPHNLVSGNNRPNSKNVPDRSSELESILKIYDNPGTVIDFDLGPIVSVYWYQPKAGSDVNKIMKLCENLALSLDVDNVRMARKSGLIAIEIPNINKATIGLGYCLNKLDGKLPWVLGTDILGDVKTVDLADMPHLLIAGQTGSGKSVAINAALCGLITKYDPSELSLILIDPKQVEFAIYRDLPHLSCPPINHLNQAVTALDDLVDKMENRLEKLSKNNYRNIDEYNKNHEPLPRIVCIIDEFSELMLVAKKQVEKSIIRLTQMARAVGIHLVIATQRPDSKTITGLIKANLPSKIAYRVNAGINSKIILGQLGAEQLSGRGDGLYIGAGLTGTTRIHSPLASTSDIMTLIRHYSKQVGDHRIQPQSTADLKNHKILKDYGGLPPTAWLQRNLGIGLIKATRLRYELKMLCKSL